MLSQRIQIPIQPSRIQSVAFETNFQSPIAGETHEWQALRSGSALCEGYTLALLACYLRLADGASGRPVGPLLLIQLSVIHKGFWC